MGTPPPGSEIVGSSDRLLRITLGALALLAAATVAVLLSRLLRTGAIEGRAAASSVADTHQALRLRSPAGAAPAGAWETLEERWAERPAIPAPSAPAAAVAAPPIAARAPDARPVAILSPPAAAPLAMAPPPTAPAAPLPGVPPTEIATAPAPGHASDPVPTPRPRATPRVRAVASEPETGDDGDGDETEAAAGSARPPADPATDPERARSERQAALRQAEERLQRLERQAEELRDRIEEEDFAEPGGKDARRLELAKVLRRLEQADREVIRAQWALREAEQY